MNNKEMADSSSMDASGLSSYQNTFCYPPENWQYGSAIPPMKQIEGKARSLIIDFNEEGFKRFNIKIETASNQKS